LASHLGCIKSIFKVYLMYISISKYSKTVVKRHKIDPMAEFDLREREMQIRFLEEGGRGSNVSNIVKLLRFK